jgi:peptidoglycan-associated lipoprotein
MKNTTVSAIASLLLAACAHKQELKTTPPAPPAPVAQETPPAAPPAAEAASPAPAPDLASFGPIYFAFDEATLTPTSQDSLRKLGDYLRAHVQASVTLSGHADERGTEEYNIALGERRADISRDYLVRYGIDAGRIKTISYGKQRPVVDGHDETAWSKNRRCEFDVGGARGQAQAGGRSDSRQP